MPNLGSRTVEYANSHKITHISFKLVWCEFRVI